MTPAPDFRALCAELIAIVEDHCNPDDYALLDVVCTLTDARAALATTPPPPPTDDELNRLRYYEFSTSTGHGECVDVLGFARAVLRKWGQR
jgi:hypothetical protein